MIVTCEQCATQFQLDDAKVPVGGVRVRCSRCKHAFFIEPAGAEIQPGPVERAAQEALDREAPPPPEASEDLAESDSDSDFRDENEISDGGGEAFGPASEPPVGGSRSRSADAASPRPGASDRFAAGEGSVDAGASDEGASDERAADARASGENAADESASDESDWEFNEDRFRGASADGERAGAPDAARAAIDDLLGSHSAPRAGGESARRASPTLASDGVDEALGNPENWDLLGVDAPAAAPAASAEIAADAQPAPRALPRAQPLAAAQVPVEEWIDPSEPSRLLAWVARSGHAIGWGVTLTLFALVALATLGPGNATHAEPGLGAQRLAQLEAQGISGRWVENVSAGPLFVVSGRLVNATSAPQPLGALSGVRLLDANGARLGGEPAVIGPVLEPRELREGEPQSLQARQREAGLALAATEIAPGQSLAFEAVLVTVPASAARFLLEPLPQGRGAPAAPASAPAH